MLLLYPFFRRRYVRSPYIYIPLCFYFIRTELRLFVLGLHLHSTMLLLYRPFWKRTPDWSINLHSTMLLLYLYAHKSNIWTQTDLHSTMLLLYRNFHATCHSRRNIFTFHYASTLSLTQWSRSWPHVLIYIPLCFYFIDDEIDWHVCGENLHSTMLLLYRR